AAAGGQHPLTLDLHHARAAVAHLVQARLVAKARDRYAHLVGDLDDRAVGRRGDLAAIELERDDGRFDLREFRPGDCVHSLNLQAAERKGRKGRKGRKKYIHGFLLRSNFVFYCSSCGKYFTTQSTGFGAACPRPQMDASRITCDSSASSGTSHLGCSMIASALAVPARQGVHCPHDSSRKKRMRFRAAALA